MIKFSRRTTLLLLLTLAVLSVAIRYPLVDHERYQTDSYFIHLLSQSVVDNHYAVWVFHPLSLFGYYPLSYPSGAPFFLAEFSSLTGLSVEVSILVADMGIAVMFSLAAFLLAREFLHRPELSLMAAFFTVMGARFVDTTYWDGSARGFMVTLAIMVAVMALRASSNRQNSLVLASILLGFGCFATHHMAVLLVFLGGAFVVAHIEKTFLFRSAVSAKIGNFPLIFTGLVVASIIILTVVFFDFFWELAVRNLKKTSLIDINPVALSVILNAGGVYANQIGLVAVFALFGLIAVLRGRVLTSRSLFLVSVMVVFIPVLGNSLYVSMILSPFVSILGTIWLARWISASSKYGRSAARTITVILVVASLLVPIWSLQKWNDQEYLSGKAVEVDNQVYADAAYLAESYEDVFGISNINVASLEFGATTDIHFLDSGIHLALNGDITPEDIKENVIWSNKPFPTNLYEWFGYRDEPNVNYYVLGLMVNGVEFVEGYSASTQARLYFSTHPSMLVVVDKIRPNEYVNSYSILEADFLEEIEAARWISVGSESSESVPLQSYSIYESQGISLYMVRLPI